MDKDLGTDIKLEDQICFPLYACARRVTGKYTPYLKPLGITYTQFLVFLVLWEQDNINVGDLCRLLYLDSGTVTPMLKKMEEKEYLQRSRCQDDERCVTVSLTEKGRELKEKVSEIPSKVGGCMNLSPEDSAKLYELLYKILDRLG